MKRRESVTKEYLDELWREFIAAARKGDSVALSAVYEKLEPAVKKSQGARKIKPKSRLIGKITRLIKNWLQRGGKHG